MFKVVCIDESCQHLRHWPSVRKGNTYTVIDEVDEKADVSGIGSCRVGIYYILAETGDETAYYHDMFIKLNEDQQDETEMERELISDKETILK